MSKGLLISLEGPDGSGKTSIFNKLEEFLTEEGYEIMMTREPGGIKIAEEIREVILNKDNTAMDGRTEALLYAAARRQHLVEKIIPALEAGKIVITDRFIDSSLAYQGEARGLGIDEILAVNQFATEGLMPDLTLYFDVSPRVGLSRISRNKEREVNRLDLETINFHEKVRQGYLKLLETYPERIIKIDANQPFNVVYTASKAILSNFIINNHEKDF